MPHIPGGSAATCRCSLTVRMEVLRDYNPISDTPKQQRLACNSARSHESVCLVGTVCALEHCSGKLLAYVSSLQLGPNGVKCRLLEIARLTGRPRSERPAQPTRICIVQSKLGANRYGTRTRGGWSKYLIGLSLSNG